MARKGKERRTTDVRLGVDGEAVLLEDVADLVDFLLDDGKVELVPGVLEAGHLCWLFFFFLLKELVLGAGGRRRG